MSSWKRFILVSSSFGAGFAIIVGGILWYQIQRLEKDLIKEYKVLAIKQEKRQKELIKEFKILAIKQEKRQKELFAEAIQNLLEKHEKKVKSQIQPKPTETWNKSAITASYDYLGIELLPDSTARKGTYQYYIVFYYTLENNNDFDYNITDASDITIMAKLERPYSLKRGNEVLMVDYPIFIPSKERLSFAIHIRHQLSGDYQQFMKSQKEPEAYVNEKMSNLDGFVLFDKKNHYQIEFPKGW